MSRVRVRLDREGVGEVLRSSGMRGAVDRAGRAVASNIEARSVDSPGQDHPSTSLRGSTRVVSAVGNFDQRPVSQVSVQHPAAAILQARYGLLTRAAGSAGLEVTSRGA